MKFGVGYLAGRAWIAPCRGHGLQGGGVRVFAEAENATPEWSLAGVGGGGGRKRPRCFDKLSMTTLRGCGRAGASPKADRRDPARGVGCGAGQAGGLQRQRRGGRIQVGEQPGRID